MSEIPKEIVNTDLYPLHAPDSLEFARLVELHRTQFETDGLCMLPEFLTRQSIEQMQKEATGSLADAWYSESCHDVYLNVADNNRTERVTTRVGSVPYDRIGQQSMLTRLYGSESLLQFIAGVLGKSRLHRLADPLGACSINVFTQGGEHGWHYDESEFSVTLSLQIPDSGGSFEYIPFLRNAADEDEQIASIVSGASDRVVELPFAEGALLIFGGRETLHRVSRVSGPTPRLVPVLCYSECAGVVNSDEVRKMFWGRVA